MNIFEALYAACNDSRKVRPSCWHQHQFPVHWVEYSQTTKGFVEVSDDSEHSLTLWDVEEYLGDWEFV